MTERGGLRAREGGGRPCALLHDLGLRGHEHDARTLLGGLPSTPQRLQAALEEIEILTAASPKGASLRALKGRLLFILGQARAARSELERALELDSGLFEARLWRAQAAIADHDAAAAMVDLEFIARGRTPSGWEQFLLGLCEMMLGRLGPAQRQLRGASRRGVGTRADAFLALALAEQGRLAPALKIIAAAKKRAGAEGVQLAAFEGLILRQAGDLEGSLRALIRAGQDPRPYPWVFSHRADVHNRMGFYHQALVDLKRFHELLPRESSAFAQAANVLYDQAYYDEALRAMKAAVQLAPKDANLQARRAQILVSAGREAEAARVLRAALRLAPGDVHLREEQIEVAVMAGNAGLARAEIARGSLTGTAFGRLNLGVLSAREGRRGTALKLFQSASSGLERGDPLRARALFYAAIVRALTPRRAGRPAPGLRLCGVGVHHPFQLSVETLRALAECKVIFTNLPDIEARRFLALFPGRVVSVPRRPDQSNRARACWVARRLSTGVPAAFLTRIHPLIYRRMGWELLELCRAKGIPVRAYGAVSLTELAGCRAVDEGCAADAGAVRVFDIGYLNRNPGLLRSEAPTVIYCIGEDRERPRLVRLLRRAFPSSGGAYLLGGSGDREDRSRWVAWQRLGSSLRLADIGCVLYVPAGRRRGE